MFRPRVVIIDHVEGGREWGREGRERGGGEEGKRNGEEQLKAIKLIDDIPNASLFSIERLDTKIHRAYAFTGTEVSWYNLSRYYITSDRLLMFPDEINLGKIA